RPIPTACPYTTLFRSYELKVPVGTAGIVEAKLADAPAADLAALKFYTVKRGDTLPLIARKLHVNKADLAEANYLAATARVAAGQDRKSTRLNSSHQIS